MQAYCYLTEFADKPVSEEKLSLLQESLDNLRRRGLKAVLRFAYERDMGLKEGPTLDWILRHIDQLQPLLRRNVDVIYVLQAGFIGAWGEWHSAARIAQDDYVARAAIIKRLLEALPEERMLQVRVPKYKRLALAQPALAAMLPSNLTVTIRSSCTPTPNRPLRVHEPLLTVRPLDRSRLPVCSARVSCCPSRGPWQLGLCLPAR